MSDDNDIDVDLFLRHPREKERVYDIGQYTCAESFPMLLLD